MKYRCIYHRNNHWNKKNRFSSFSFLLLYFAVRNKGEKNSILWVFLTTTRIKSDNNCSSNISCRSSHRRRTWINLVDNANVYALTGNSTTMKKQSTKKKKKEWEREKQTERKKFFIPWLRFLFFCHFTLWFHSAVCRTNAYHIRYTRRYSNSKHIGFHTHVWS